MNCIFVPISAVTIVRYFSTNNNFPIIWKVKFRKTNTRIYLSPSTNSWFASMRFSCTVIVKNVWV